MGFFVKTKKVLDKPDLMCYHASQQLHTKAQTRTRDLLFTAFRELPFGARQQHAIYLITFELHT